ncbi:MAG: hypothetical protein ACPGU1_04420 [Myxococcota bacterium]
MPDNVFIQLPLVIQDLYSSVNDLPVGPLNNERPRTNAQSTKDDQDTGAVGQR